MAKAHKIDELQSFTWAGIDKVGKKLKGEQQAKSVILAKNELRRQGIQVQKIKKKSGVGPFSEKTSFSKPKEDYACNF